MCFVLFISELLWNAQFSLYFGIFLPVQIEKKTPSAYSAYLRKKCQAFEPTMWSNWIFFPSNAKLRIVSLQHDPKIRLTNREFSQEHRLDRIAVHQQDQIPSARTWYPSPECRQHIHRVSIHSASNPCHHLYVNHTQSDPIYARVHQLTAAALWIENEK